jgi:hypothetical protein
VYISALTVVNIQIAYGRSPSINHRFADITRFVMFLPLPLRICFVELQSMMTHIATQWGWLYDSMNAKVTVANYKRYKVVDMCKKKRRRSSIKASAITASSDTTAATTGTTTDATAIGDAVTRQRSVVELQCESIRCGYDVSTDSNAESVTSSGTVDTTTSASTGRSSSTDLDSSTVTAVTYDAAAAPDSTTSSNDSNSATVMRTEVPTADLLHELQQLPQRRRSSSAAITAVAATEEDDDSDDVSSDGESPCDDVAGDVVHTFSTATAATATAAAAASGTGTTATAGADATAAGAATSCTATSAGVSSDDVNSERSERSGTVVQGLELSDLDIDAISGHREFHRVFTVPFSGDASVDDYIARVERMHAEALTSVNVPVLALLAEVSADASATSLLLRTSAVPKPFVQCTQNAVQSIRSLCVMVEAVCVQSLLIIEHNTFEQLTAVS